MTQAQFEHQLLGELYSQGFMRLSEGEHPEAGELARSDVQDLLDIVGEQIERALRKRGEERVIVRGLGRFRVVRRKATRARRGINPFTGQETTFKAKPARRVVKVTPAPALRDALAR